jgi:hypothetical protein
MKLTLLLILISSTNGLNCSGNLTHGYTKTVQTIPATLSQFVSIVGSFYNSTWYSYPTSSTIGPNNQINSTRIITDSTDTLVFYETLLVNILNNTYFEQSWTGPGDKIGTDNFGTFILGTYIETLSGQSSCRGSGVIINFGIEFCATNLSSALDGLAQGHVNGIQEVQTLLGIGNMTTCQSIGNLNKSNHLFIVLIWIFF